MNRVTVEPGAGTAASLGRDLEYLWSCYERRWQAALQPPWPDPDLLRLAADEAHRLATAFDSRDGQLEWDEAWEAVTTAGNLLDLYGRAAQLACCCEVGFRLPEAFRPLATSCRAALKHAGAAVAQLTQALEAG